MKCFKFTLTCLACLSLATSSYALTVAAEGQDQRIEWKVIQNWPTESRTLDMVYSLDGKYVYILNDRNQVQIFNGDGQLQGNIPIEEGVSSIDISPQGNLLYLINNVKNTFSSVSVSFVADVDTAGSPFKGPVDAPVTLAVFTDFECPYCSKILPLLEQVLEKNPETLKLVFKNMPLKFHKAAEPAARAALAAQEQDKFWEFHDKLFAVKKLTMEAIEATAMELKLDMVRFKKDMNSSKIRAKLQKDLLDAQSAGVTGTPTVFINGRKPTQRSLQAYQTIIDDELKKQGR